MSQQPSKWAAGFAGFAGVMLVVIGFFQACAGVVAIANDEFFIAGQEWVFKFDVTTWGWIHLILGVVVLASGFFVFTGNVAARAVGGVVAAASMLAAFLWLPWYPVWGVIIIALDVAVIWALTCHGHDIEKLS
mgnify:CR=1 FL=1